MKVALLDVNLLVALAWPNHIHHETAHTWFASNRRFGWATCPLTQTGFVRVCSNPRIIPGATTPAEAILHLRRIVGLPGHSFWPDDVSLVKSRFVVLERLVGHNQVTDAHLLALALRRGGRLATFDRGVRSLLPREPSAVDAIVVVGETAAKANGPLH